MHVRRPILVATILLAGCARLGFGPASPVADSTTSGDRSGPEWRWSDARSDLAIAPDGTRRDGAPPSTPLALRVGGLGDDYGAAVAIDGSGGFCVAGSFENLLTIGSITFASGGLADALLVCFDSGGKATMAKRLGGVYNDRAHAVALDPAGNVYVAGYFTGSADLGGELIGAKGQDDGFVASFSASGVFRWASRFGSPGVDQASGLAVGAGRVCVIGTAAPGTTFAKDILIGAGAQDVALGCFGLDGAPLWATMLGSVGDDAGRAVALDASGNLYLTGSVGGAAVKGAVAPRMPFKGGTDLFLASLDVNGATRWWYTYGGDGLDSGRAVTLDGAGRVIVTGDFQFSTVFNDAVALGPAAGSDVLVLAHKTAGPFIWAKGFQGNGNDRGLGVAARETGDLYITGSFESAVSFGGPLHGSKGPFDIFVAGLTPTGGHRWSKSHGAALDDQGHAVAVAGEAVVVTGHFEGAIDFGTGTLNSDGTDLFVLRLPP